MKAITLTLFTLSTLIFGINSHAETYTDTDSGLQWQDDTAAKETKITWTEAINYCEDLTLATYSDWRLPNRIELLSTINFSIYPAQILSDFQNYIYASYWTSSTYPIKHNEAFYVRALYKSSYPIVSNALKNATLYVRCVRGGNVSVSPPPDPNPIAHLQAVFSLLLDTTSNPIDWTSRFLYKDNLDWISKQDLSSSEFNDYFDTYSRQGYILVDIDVRTEGNTALYSMVWQENIDGRAWREHHNLTSEEYHDLWLQYQNSGYRPLDIEAYMLNGVLRYAGIWIKNTEGLGWTSVRNLSSSEYADYFDQHKTDGYRPIDIEVYSTDSGMQVAAIWYKNVDNIQWTQLRNMDHARYQQELEVHNPDLGWRMVDFESYDAGSAQQYAAIWKKLPNLPLIQVHEHDLTQLDSANTWRTSRDLGFRLVDFENYNVDGQVDPEYGGIWLENAVRVRYSRQQEIYEALNLYFALNALPGISMSVIRNGEMIFRRGIGFADVAAEKIAHGETVYSAASVSKVIGGTLAARLENNNSLLDGTTFQLDLTSPTDDYISSIQISSDQFAILPSHHTHTIEQLLSHLSCVAHYTTTPSIPDQETHYANASTAVTTIWDTDLVTLLPDGKTSCTMGSTESYSTPAFTFLGAVLEAATGQNINTLLENEIFKPNGLSNTRVMYKTSSPLVDYDRAKPYVSRDSIDKTDPDNWIDPPNYETNPNVETVYYDTSWKVLGGGIESTVVDLANFGWFTLNGDIIDATARDNRMWKPVVTGNWYGLSWVLARIGDRNVVQHDGSQNGARSFIRIYEDDGLVIAIMSNRRNHRSDMNMDISNFATQIGDIVLEK